MEKELLYLQTEVCYLQKNLERTDICNGERESTHYEIIKLQRDIFMLCCLNGINPGISSTYFNPFYPWKGYMKETIVLYVIFIFVAIFVANCGLLPEEEVYKTDRKINDNFSASSYSIYIG